MSAAVLHMAGRNTMASPEQHPTWVEFILGSALFTVLLPKAMDWLRSSSALRRKEDATVRVAEIEDEAKFRAELMARVSHLEAQQAASISQISKLEMEQSLMRRQLEGILQRGEAAIGGEPPEIMSALRQTLYELRTILGHAPYPTSTIIGSTERQLGDG